MTLTKRKQNRSDLLVFILGSLIIIFLFHFGVEKINFEDKITGNNVKKNRLEDQ